MNQPEFRQFQFNLSGIGCWLVLLGVIWLLGAVGLGWLVKSLAVLVVLIMLAPVLLFVGLRFWLKRNLIQANCPVCSAPLTGLKGAETLCPSCGTPLRVSADGFQRLTDDGTIDVTAVDITVDSIPILPEGEADRQRN
ncbi:MAG: hypothetical protein HC929_20690 [Leptolyngbyaceae cyanobacterium SM2_5_2]|nr:hypothetical protein [Leptolyngbyaceae cyanobacterium SM2_5_2]